MLVRRALRATIIILLITVFFAINPYFYDYFELPKVLVFLFLMGLGCFLYVVTVLQEKNPTNSFAFFQTKLGFLLLGFLVVAVISAGVAGTADSFWGQPHRYQGLLFFMGLTFFALLVSEHKKIGLSFKTIQKTIVFSGIFQAVLIVIQGFLHTLHLPIYTFGGRMTGLVGHPNSTAGFLVLSYIYLFYYCREKKVWLSVLTIVWAIAVLLTDSRAGIVSFGGVLGYLLLQNFGKKMGVIVFLPVLVLAVYFFPQRQSSHFDSRQVIWQKGVAAFLDKPVLGWGLENFANAFQAQTTPGDFDLPQIRVDKAHNEFLEIAVATGSIGVAFYLAMIGYAAWLLWRKRKEAVAKQQLLVICAFMILAQFNIVSIAQYIFLFLALGVAGTQQQRV